MPNSNKSNPIFLTFGASSSKACVLTGDVHTQPLTPNCIVYLVRTPHAPNSYRKSGAQETGILVSPERPGLLLNAAARAGWLLIQAAQCRVAGPPSMRSAR